MEIEKKIWNFILEVSADDQTQFKFNNDYRIIKPDGKEVWVLAQNPVLQSDSKGNITHVLGVYSDISQLKISEHQMVSIILATNGYCYFFTCDDSYIYKPQNSLSRREVKIVRLLAKGYVVSFLRKSFLSASIPSIYTGRRSLKK